MERKPISFIAGFDMSEIDIHGHEELYGEPFEGVNLVRLINSDGKYTVNGEVMREGNWGLTFSNDPFFIFSMDPVLDPDYDELLVTDEDWTEELEEQFHKFMEVAAHYNERTHVDLGTVHRLLKTLTKHGYDEEKHGGPHFYLVHHLYLHLESVGWKPQENK